MTNRVLSHQDLRCALHRKSDGLCMSQLSKLDHLTQVVEVSIVDHGDTILLDVGVISA